MKVITLIVFVCLTGICLCGCTGQQKPDGFPETVSFGITVTKSGSPVVGARVTLYSESGSDLAIGGLTRSDGSVDLATTRGSYSQKGAPLGTFKVTVNKEKVVPDEMSEEERAKLAPQEAVAYQKKLNEQKKKLPHVIPLQFTSLEKTPLTVTISSNGSATLNVD